MTAKDSACTCINLLSRAAFEEGNELWNGVEGRLLAVNFSVS